jgi:SanA protein
MVKFLKMLLRILLYTAGSAVLLVGLVCLSIRLYANSLIFKPADAPQGRVAIVFGAGLYRDGQPTPVLRDRVQTAADLYFSGKVDKLLLSGDNRFEYYNEPGAMKTFALELGVPSDAIVLDYAGRRTYDTCYRASAIFGLSHAILVTQQFHLPRALFLCNNFGIKAVGVSADLRTYNRLSQARWLLRESFATVVAVWESWVSKPIPVLGDPEPIYPTGQAKH